MMDPDDTGKTPQDKQIDTGGGAYVGGSVQTGGGDFVGRDKHVHVYTRSDQEKLETFIREAVLAYQRHLTDVIWTETPSEPYKFLLPFGLKDQNIFFGRDEAINNLFPTIFKSRLTVLHAPSGAGKSSLLNAGLGPRLLKQQYLPIFARTYDDPVSAIVAEIANRGTPPAPPLLPVLPLREFLHLVVEYMGRRVPEVVIILDQFEEMFTRVLPANRPEYLKALADCIEDEGLPLRLVLAVRGDFFSQLAEFEERLPHIFHNQFYLTEMTIEEAREAIIGPVRQVDSDVTYEQVLLDTLLAVLARDEMDLPELQILCSRLYELAKERAVNEINRGLYEQAGGARGILTGYLDQALARFSPEERSVAWHVLMELVDSLGQRRIISRSELGRQLDYTEESLTPVLNRLVSSRLVQRTEGDRYDLAHDYLALTIKERIGQAELEHKQIRELLQREVASWRASGSLISRDRLELINQQSHTLPELNSDELELLCRSAVAHQLAIERWALAAHQQGVDIWPILQPALTAPDFRTRGMVIAILPMIGAEAVAALEQALTDEIPRVRVQAIRALHRIQSDTASRTPAASLRHERYIPPVGDQPDLYFDRYPVTNAAYELFLQDNPDHEPPLYWTDRSAPPHRQDHPVVGVNWFDAQAYAAWAGKRLPTAKEWQRAGGWAEGRRYPWGDRFTPDRCNIREAGWGTTTPVGYYSPASDSPFGVADMAGNVWEWLANEAGAEGQARQLRGGAWFYTADFARLDYKQFWREPDYQQDVIGFRLCFSQTEQEEKE
jgi:hypothetical protein